MAVIMGLGLLFYILWGFRYTPVNPSKLQGAQGPHTLSLDRVQQNSSILKGLYWEPQEHNRNTMEHKDPGMYIPIIFLLFSWGSLFGVAKKVPSNPANPKP